MNNIRQVDILDGEKYLYEDSAWCVFSEALSSTVTKLFDKREIRDFHSFMRITCLKKEAYKAKVQREKRSNGEIYGQIRRMKHLSTSERKENGKRKN